MKMNFVAAFVLAILLAIAGTQAKLMAYEGYGTGNCSLWAKILAELYGVDCHYLMNR